MWKLLTKKSVSVLEVIILATASIGCLGFILWTFHFKDYHRLVELPRLAGKTLAEVRQAYGEPYKIDTGEEYNRTIQNPQTGLNPAPKTQLGIDEVWYYYIGNNVYALLYFKDGIVVGIHTGAT